MAKKKETNEDITKIKKAIDDKKLIIGSQRVVKELKRSKLLEVFITANCENRVKEDLKHYSSMQKVKLTSLDINNEELGVICKKPFSVSIIGISA